MHSQSAAGFSGIKQLIHVYLCHAEGGQAADAISIATAKALSFGAANEQSAFANALVTAIAQNGCNTIKPVIASMAYCICMLSLLLLPCSSISVSTQ